MSNLLSEAAQAMIDKARQERNANLSVEQLLEEEGAILGLETLKATSLASKPRYTAEAMVQLMIDHPEYSHKEFAAHFGYKPSWFAGVLISNNFQAALQQRRSEVSNPTLTGTMDDMFRSLTVQALTVIQQRLEHPQVTEDFMVKAAALGVKALGMGTPGQLAAPPTAPASLSDLAKQLSAPATPIGKIREYTIEATLEELPK